MNLARQFRQLHNYVAAHSDVYVDLKEGYYRVLDNLSVAREQLAEVKQQLRVSQKQAMDSHKLMWWYAKELHKERPGIAEQNKRGKFLPKFPGYFPQTPLKAEGADSPVIVFDEASLRGPWTAEEIKTLAEALGE